MIVSVLLPFKLYAVRVVKGRLWNQLYAYVPSLSLLDNGSFVSKISGRQGFPIRRIATIS
jgi:hypothetical protein